MTIQKFNRDPNERGAEELNKLYVFLVGWKVVHGQGRPERTQILHISLMSRSQCICRGDLEGCSGE